MNTMGSLMDEYESELLAKTREEIAREDADPAHRAKLMQKLADNEAKIDAEIAAGLRDADGIWIDEEDEDDEWGMCPMCGECHDPDDDCEQPERDPDADRDAAQDPGRSWDDDHDD